MPSPYARAIAEDAPGYAPKPSRSIGASDAAHPAALVIRIQCHPIRGSKSCWRVWRRFLV